ncbi:hypothetical protein Hdeb2414_s0101g00793691 [Helianthus debilis subsp. tardiflorus]
MVKNRTKGNAALPVDTCYHIGCSSSVHKVKGKRAANIQKKLNRRNKIAKTAKKKHSGHLLDPEFFHFDRKRDYRLRLPAEVARRAGLSLDLHPLKVQNMVGVVEVYDVKSELNELNPRYALDGWQSL